jgi:endonuclease/exonuclease/phosphatase family metal-dependent hydrolase
VSGDRDNPNLYGNALLSRFPISKGKVHKLMLQEGQEPRVCIEARVRVNFKDYTIMVTHLDHQKNEVRIRQAQDILAVADSIQGPVILMGDFNCRPPGENASDEWARKTRPVGLILEKFQDSFLLAGEDQPGTVGGDRRIDYIFVSSDLVDDVESCRVIRTSLTDVASDHRPVVARIGL